MTKKIFEDMEVPVERKSIKNIPLPKRKRVKSDSDNIVIEESITETETTEEIIDLRNAEPLIHKKREPVYEDEIKINNTYTTENMSDLEDEEDIEPNFILNKNKKGKKSKNKFVLITVIILVLVIGLMSVFKSASLVIYPKTEKIQNSEIILQIENTLSNSSPDILDYKEISLESVAEINTKSDSEEKVSESASGIITIYNEYSKDPQKLIAKTRFQTPDGKVYRIQESVTVPGYTEANGKKLAGSVEAKVVADEAGEKFNLASGEFKIPGFQGQEQYNFFYAKTKTEISGGFVGIKKIITPENLEIAEKELKTRIKNNLTELAKNQISDDFITLEKSNSYTFTAPEQKGSKGNDVVLSMKGYVKLVVIAKDDLANAIAKQSLGVLENTTITNLNDIQISLIESEENQSLNIKGNIELKWVINDEELKKDLSGKPKKQIFNVVENYPGIKSVENIVVRPIWSSKFPKDLNDIKVIEMQ